MTFEEYKKKRKEAEPRSIAMTIFFTMLAVGFIFCLIATIVASMQSGFTFVLLLLGIVLFALALYCITCAIDGKRLSSRESVDFLLMLVWL